MLGNNEEALQDLENALGLEPNNIEIILNKAIVNYKMTNFKKAIDGYSEVLNSRPKDYKTYYRRGLAFYMLNTFQNAFNDYNTALAINNAYVPAIFERAKLLFEQGDYEAALADLDVLKTIDNQYAPAYDFTGDIYAIEDPIKAVSNYIVAKKLDPANTKRYDAKIKLMTSERGRKTVINKRLQRI
jgi:tetratricopeptide (TPR) repeat protein